MTTAAINASTQAAVIIAQAIKASGVIVSVEPEDFLLMVDLNPEPLAVHAIGGFFSKNHQYLTSYRGLAFFAKSGHLLALPAHCQVIEAKKIWIPG